MEKPFDYDELLLVPLLTGGATDLPERQQTLRNTLAVNRFRDVSAARQLLARAIPVSPDQLRDEAVDLKVLARSVGSAPMT